MHRCMPHSGAFRFESQRRGAFGQAVARIGLLETTLCPRPELRAGPPLNRTANTVLKRRVCHFYFEANQFTALGHCVSEKSNLSPFDSIFASKHCAQPALDVCARKRKESLSRATCLERFPFPPRRDASKTRDSKARRASRLRSSRRSPPQSKSALASSLLALVISSTPFPSLHPRIQHPVSILLHFEDAFSHLRSSPRERRCSQAAVDLIIPFFCKYLLLGEFQ